MSIIPELLYTRRDRKTCIPLSMLLQRKFYNHSSPFLFFTFPSPFAFLISLLSFLVTYTLFKLKQRHCYEWINNGILTQVNDPSDKPLGKSTFLDTIGGE